MSTSRTSIFSVKCPLVVTLFLLSTLYRSLMRSGPCLHCVVMVEVFLIVVLYLRFYLTDPSLRPTL